MSITYEDALKLVNKHIKSTEINSDEEFYKPIIIENEIIERDYGWFFRFTNKAWLEQKIEMAPGSCCPVLVLKEKGVLIQLGSTNSFEGYVVDFDKRFEDGRI